ERFAEMFVRSRVARGQGEMKIRYELRQRGVKEYLIDAAVLEEGVDWLLLAKEQREKRFGREIPKDFKERARQSRFLAGRGFSGDIISGVF
ncbi:MAG: regulatory protein RecX, partial [Aquificaceae bacterium]